MKALSASAAAIVATLIIAGCAQDGTLTTGALNPSITGPQTADGPDAKSDPVCLTLASQIDALKKHGVAEKVSKAAAKKYKMKAADLAKADELNKANAEFQSRCSNYPAAADVAAATPTEPAADVLNKSAAKTKPPLPSPKPVVSAAATPPAMAAPATAAEPAAAPATAPATSEAVAQSPPQP